MSGWNDNAPTTADYAHAAASNNKDKLKELEERIKKLEIIILHYFNGVMPTDHKTP